MARLGRTNSAFSYASLIATALATILAGLTAAKGPLAGHGAPAWKWTCGLVAVLSGLGALATGLLQRLAVPERYAKAQACTGRLASLELSLTLEKKEPELVARDYLEVISQYPQLLLETRDA